MYRKFNYLFLILSGISFGLLWIMAPGITFSIVALLAVAFLIWRFNDSIDRNFLIRLFIFAIIARIIFGFGLHFYSLATGGYGATFADDSGKPRLAWRIAEYYKGLTESIYDPWEERNFHTNFLAILFYFFGFSRMTGKMFNMLFGVLTSIFIFFIGKEVFNRSIARFSAILVAFFPSIFLWSCVNLKEILVLFFLVIYAWVIIQFQNKYRLRFLLFILFTLSCIFQLRPSLAAVLLPISFMV